MGIPTPVTLGVLALVVAAPGAAQEAASPKPLEVGTVAPNFTLPGATRYGVLAQPIHLRDFRGKTVVLAFFYKARSSG